MWKKEWLIIVVGLIVGSMILVLLLNMIVGKIFPFMIYGILLLLFIVTMGTVLHLGGRKEAWIVIGSFVFGLWFFSIYYQHTCEPNKEDVKVMKPMAEAIRDYIVKHGVPERLEEIPNLPYRLENCKKEITYGDENDIPRSYVTKNSKWEESIEVCYFKNITLSLRFVKNLKDEKKGLEGSLRMDSSHGTVSSVFIYQIRNGQFVFQDIHFSGKISGICNPMRQ